MQEYISDIENNIETNILNKLENNVVKKLNVKIIEIIHQICEIQIKLQRHGDKFEDLDKNYRRILQFSTLHGVVIFGLFIILFIKNYR